ncbi:MAG: lipid-A-disaccharide synthase [Rhodospirillales bacterium]|nr:lipid-A-disaccharide synthase [Rhodospirillales bacterium]MCB9995626.1 lipid-A-disaccharide synthase [Rhodospirillales bacterium]
MPRDKAPLKIMITAGEASGDVLGARLMAALKQQAGTDISFIGVGGPMMEAEGLRSLFPMRDLSVMGIVEVLPKLTKLLRRIKQTSDLVKKEQPDILVTIDAPDFNFRVAHQVRENGDTPVMIHYGAPTVWAWRPERAGKVAALYDGMMCLYPFEPPYFEAAGLDAAFVGHPVMQSGFDQADGAVIRQGFGIEDDAPVLGILFGSRMGELNRIGPVLREAAGQIAGQADGLHILAPTLPHLQSQVTNLLQGLPCTSHVLTDPARKWDAFKAMNFAMATSGTVGLELAVAGVPHVIAYKMNALTWQILKRKVTVKYAHLANILLDAPVVPEFIQHDAKPDALVAGLYKAAGKNAAEQTAAFEKVRSMLGGSGQATPADQAARYILEKAYLRSSIGT